MKRIYQIIITLVIICMNGILWAHTPEKWSSDKYIICDTNIENWPEIEKTGIYNPDSIITDGFIHCTRPSQMFFVANKYYENEHMLLWLIDPARLTSPLKYEGTLNSNLYPHVYGPINMSAVIDTKEMKPNPDGTYDIPHEFFSDAWKDHPEHFAFCGINNKDWVSARLQGEYKPDELDTLGYMTCSNSKNNFAADRVILVADIRKIVAPIKKEDKSNTDLDIHIYGPLNMDAVTDVLKNGH